MTAPDRPLDEGVHVLNDGRRLRWAQWGVTDGHPVLLFHGNPGSRLFRFSRPSLEAAQARLITVDRPGCGGSSPRPGRRMVDWAEDVAQLADALGVGRFPVIGISMGAPHALACGAMLGQRVSGIAIHGTPGPWSESGFEELAPPQIREMRAAFDRDAETAEQHYRDAIGEQRQMMLEQPRESLVAFVSRLSRADHWLLDDAAALEGALEDATEGIRAGIEGFFEERMAGYVLDWGFRLSDVEVPVTVFYGTDDSWIPPDIGRAVSHRLSHATAHELEGIGHFLPWSLREELLAAVVGDTARTR